jgi:pimeloyl-ACP methyl ester carboxylesterase
MSEAGAPTGREAPVATMISVEAWKRAGGFFDWRGHRIFFRTAGSGEPLLLVHGFPTASWDYVRVWDRLATRYRVLTLDMLGFGFSAKPRRFPYSILAQADLFQAFLVREGVTSYHVLAHDYGDTVAQELLARDGRIASACLLNGGLFPEMHRPLAAQRLLASPLGPLFAPFGTYRMFVASMRKIWGDAPVGDAELRSMWQLIAEHDGQAVLPQLLGYMRERRVHRTRWVDALAGARVPIRFVNGLRDPISGAHMVARYRELVPRPDVVELPTVGHYPQVEAPDAVADAALALFSRNLPGRAGA